MPAAPANVQSYAHLLVRSRLLSADKVKDALRRWQEAGKAEPADVDGFRKFLVTQRLLTEYQAALVNRGHTEGFFLDQYEILERIGKGRMAGVYKGRHVLGQTVAIKVLPSSKAKDPAVLARFQREGRLLTRLDHPNVVRAFQVGDSGGRHFVVMEQLEGDTLEEVLARRKRLPPFEAIRIAYQALMGLQHLHEKGMIHRDIKPANLMLVPAPGPGQPDNTLQATVKILDIGLGREVFDEDRPDDEAATQLTGDGVLLGTPDYLAPEQARSAREADIRSDIYSVGCVLYHMLTGQTPFPDSNILNQVLRHATEQAKPLADFLQPVPDGLQPVINWMLAKDPGQRYPTPERAAQALQVFLMDGPEGAAPAPANVSGAFLQWLQKGGHIEAPKGAQAALPPTAEVEVIPIGKLEEPGRKAEKARPAAETAKSKEQPRAKAAGSAPVLTALPADDFDVELVSMPPPGGQADEEEERRFFEFNRRDWLLFALGGGVVAFAGLSVYGISQLMRRKDTQSEPPPPNEDAKKDETPKEQPPE
jgi:eukaryotic-like serine/threonine-protein kinase